MFRAFVQQRRFAGTPKLFEDRRCNLKLTVQRVGLGS